jgi:Arc/MetJ-type ribon-helix-helix transcriptional regulator
MKIDLTPEQEAIVKRMLQSGNFRTVEEVIGEALQALCENERPSTVIWANRAQQRAVREMIDFVGNNRARLDGVAVKALIHESHRP